MKKKINPKKKPATQADVKRAMLDGINEGAKFLFAAMMMALKDRHDIDNDTLADIWNTSRDYLKAIVEPNNPYPLKIEEVLEYLSEEHNITWETI